MTKKEDQEYGSKCFHSKQAVRIGPYTIFAGARFNMREASLEDIDLVVSLTEYVPANIWNKGYRHFVIWSFPIPDYYGPSGPWNMFLEKVIEKLSEGKKIFAFCDGGHGRTGTLLASLIAKIEKPEDPIEVLRERYCPKAVETLQQAKTVFGLLGLEMPEKYGKNLFDANELLKPFFTTPRKKRDKNPYTN